MLTIYSLTLTRHWQDTYKIMYWQDDDKMLTRYSKDTILTRYSKDTHKTHARHWKDGDKMLTRHWHDTDKILTLPKQLTSEMDMVGGWPSTHATLHHQEGGGPLLLMHEVVTLSNIIYTTWYGINTCKYHFSCLVSVPSPCLLRRHVSCWTVDTCVVITVWRVMWYLSTSDISPLPPHLGSDHTLSLSLYLTLKVCTNHLLWPQTPQGCRAVSPGRCVGRLVTCQTCCCVRHLAPPTALHCLQQTLGAATHTIYLLRTKPISFSVVPDYSLFSCG